MEVDVRQVDGEPWEVAAATGAAIQSELGDVFDDLSELRWAVRGSWLSQEHYRTGDMPNGNEFPDNVLSRRLDEVEDLLTKAKKGLHLVTLAASHDPTQI